MATAAIKVCDRAGCGKHLGNTGGRFAFSNVGEANDYVGPMRVGDEFVDGVDLCKDCWGSLVLWWSSIERRAAAKEGAPQ